jgi:hypothetical protein
LLATSLLWTDGGDAQLRWGKTLGGDSFLYCPWIGLTCEVQNLDLSWDFRIGDLFQQASLRECYFGWSVHHRSGIFGSSDFLGNVDGGGNVNTLYLQCHNRG